MPSCVCAHVLRAYMLEKCAKKFQGRKCERDVDRADSAKKKGPGDETARILQKKCACGGNYLHAYIYFARENTRAAVLARFKFHADRIKSHFTHICAHILMLAFL